MKKKDTKSFDFDVPKIKYSSGILLLLPKFDELRVAGFFIASLKSRFIIT